MTRHAWNTGTVECGGESIYYESVGDPDRPTVALTHGAGGSHAAWFQQVPALADAGYRVITWDTRGFGNSTFVSGTHGCDAAVDDLSAVLDAVGVERAHLVGQSMGGWWAASFSLRKPERVRSLTLSNTVAGLWTDPLREHFRTFVTAPPTSESVLGAHTALHEHFVDRDPARAFLYQQLNTFHEPPMAAVAGALMSTSYEHAAMNALGLPILMISGDGDRLFPAPLLRDSAAQLTNARFVEIADAGHSPYFERPEEYNAALLEFIAGVGTGS